MAVLTREGIMQIIPHRDPFLLVDEIDFLDMDTMHVIGKKFVTGEEYFFKGHFPGNPIMPGVLILESLAQTGAVCLLDKPEFKGKIALFARANNVRFKGMVLPGDTLVLDSQMLRLKAGVCICQGIATVNGKTVLEAEVTCAIK